MINFIGALDYLENQSGTAQIAIRGTANNQSVEHTFTVTVNPVNDAPTVQQVIASQVATEDSEFNFTIPDDTFEDVDGDELTYTANLADGSDLPDWLDFDGINFAGTPNNDDVGTISIKLTADDSNGGKAETTFELTVNNTNDTPTVANPNSNQWIEANSPYNYTLNSDLFLDVDHDNLTIKVKNLPVWLNYEAQTQEISGIAPNTAQTLILAVEADDGHGGIATDSFYLFITEPIPVEGDRQLVIGNEDNNQIVTNKGMNRVNGNGGNDYIQGGSDRDLLFGGSGDDLILGGSGDDLIGGNDGDDLLNGENGNDNIIAGNGNDVLIGGAGDDNLVGNGGSDIFVLDQQTGNDKIIDFEGGIDYFGLGSLLDYENLDFVTNGNNTAIYNQISGELLATVLNHQASSINNANYFVNFN